MKLGILLPSLPHATVMLKHEVPAKDMFASDLVSVICPVFINCMVVTAQDPQLFPFLPVFENLNGHLPFSCVCVCL